VGHKVALTVREAVFSESERIPVSEAVGRVAAAPTVSCPPAVPIVVSGEVIDADDISLFTYYGITEVDVVK
jgi:arginine/lysine/ornithine decarboxylase